MIRRLSWILVVVVWVACAAGVVLAQREATVLFRRGHQLPGWLLAMSSFWLLGLALALNWIWLGRREKPGYAHPAKRYLKGCGLVLFGLWLALLAFSLM